ncbi:MAG: DUF1643 domain-containing protein [Patulibacter minatonensis]
MAAPAPSARPSIRRSARWSSCGAHRLLLERHWDGGTGLVGFVMLNPSVADAERDDPTIRRCIGFARTWGFGGLLVANLFTLASTDPRRLARARERNHPDADLALRDVAARSDLVIEAWGANALCVLRADRAHELLQPTATADLGCTRSGAPRHPLYVRAATRPHPRA